MDSELLRIFDSNHEPIGEATREEVHTKGLWHETFHCWLVSKIGGQNYLYFQLRSACKKDYASQFDITAAGHLLANERAEDGIRELQEELGLPLKASDLKKLGVFETRIQQPSIIDLEFAHVYYVARDADFEGFHLQEEEVAGIVCAELGAVQDFYSGRSNTLYVEGFEVIESGEKIALSKNATYADFVGYNTSYMENVLAKLHEVL
ncbi:NUDIX hydrolase [Viridibacillus sp. YIM B01967]|uniref:NUDIX hydrolase n=1 Tax=Viridibacillus soli TaxID=2798301 RepID=A0ABS1H5C0_9BACL|nr:NUDIX hydrolase [Viridibacillus soli]MBK3494619.1 NUDIX hydrolase [Viridibacillus soli]